jgi:hypothetical protein
MEPLLLGIFSFKRDKNSPLPLKFSVFTSCTINGSPLTPFSHSSPLYVFFFLFFFVCYIPLLCNLPCLANLCNTCHFKINVDADFIIERLKVIFVFENCKMQHDAFENYLPPQKKYEAPGLYFWAPTHEPQGGGSYLEDFISWLFRIHSPITSLFGQ